MCRHRRAEPRTAAAWLFGSVASRLTGSIFNQQLICVPCVLKERAHPLFTTAVAAEEAAVSNGDMNFPGIGLPPDLEPPEGGETDESRKEST